MNEGNTLFLRIQDENGNINHDEIKKTKIDNGQNNNNMNNNDNVSNSEQDDDLKNEINTNENNTVDQKDQEVVLSLGEILKEAENNHDSVPPSKTDPDSDSNENNSSIDFDKINQNNLPSNNTTTTVNNNHPPIENKVNLDDTPTNLNEINIIPNSDDEDDATRPLSGSSANNSEPELDLEIDVPSPFNFRSIIEDNNNSNNKKVKNDKDKEVKDNSMENINSNNPSMFRCSSKTHCYF